MKAGTALNHMNRPCAGRVPGSGRYIRHVNEVIAFLVRVYAGPNIDRIARDGHSQLWQCTDTVPRHQTEQGDDHDEEIGYCILRHRRHGRSNVRRRSSVCQSVCLSDRMTFFTAV